MSKFVAAVSTISLFFSVALSAADGNEKTNGLVAQAHELVRSGHFDEALLNYEEAMSHAPGDNALRLSYATLLFQLGMTQNAFQIINEAVDSGSTDVAVHRLYRELADIEMETMPATAPPATAEQPGTQAIAPNSIAWSKQDADTDMAEIAEQLNGGWCVELVDLYHHEGGICVSDPLAGDIVTLSEHPTINIRIDATTNRLTSDTLADTTGIDVRDDAILGLDHSVGDGYTVHRIRFSPDRYLDVSVTNGQSRCMQMREFDEGGDATHCSNAFTLCRCDN